MIKELLISFALVFGSFISASLGQLLFVDYHSPWGILVMAPGAFTLGILVAERALMRLKEKEAASDSEAIEE